MFQPRDPNNNRYSLADYHLPDDYPTSVEAVVAHVYEGATACIGDCQNCLAPCKAYSQNNVGLTISQAAKALGLCWQDVEKLKRKGVFRLVKGGLIARGSVAIYKRDNSGVLRLSNPHEKYWTTKQVADEYGVTPKAVEYWIAQKLITFETVKGSRRRYFLVEQFVEFKKPTNKTANIVGMYTNDEATKVLRISRSGVLWLRENGLLTVAEKRGNSLYYLQADVDKLAAERKAAKKAKHKNAVKNLQGLIKGGR